MAVTITASPNNFLPTSDNPLTIGSRRCWVGTITGDSSYPTGGYTLDPNLFGLDRIGSVISPADPSSTSMFWVWNLTTNKLQAFVYAGTEVANTTNLSAITGVVLILAH